MDTKSLGIIGALILGVITIGLVLWYMNEHPAPFINKPSQVGTGQNTTNAGTVPLTLNESAAYYDITASYPSTTSLKSGVGSNADAKAVALMKQFEQKEIADFKTQGNFANLTHDDVQIMGLDQRKESLEITYDSRSGTHTVSYLFTIHADTLGAHPNTYFRTFTFDTKTGTVLALGDIFVPGTDYLSLLSTKTRALLPAVLAQREGGKASSVDKTMMNAGTEATIDSFQDWYIDGNNLVLLFPPYAVAPYSAGVITLPIPLSQFPAAPGANSHVTDFGTVY